MSVDYEWEKSKKRKQQWENTKNVWAGHICQHAL